MKERPIMFSAPMVRAILGGSKTMTRRVVKPQPFEVSQQFGKMPGLIRLRESDDCLSTWADACHYGRPGDRLWVRETWWHRKDDGVISYAVDGHLSFDKSSIAHKMGIGDTPCDLRSDDEMRSFGFVKRPSIFLPRWASRITLEITRVRVERLQEITEDDADHEGFPCKGYYCDEAVGHIDCGSLSRFRALWEKLNGPRGFGWDANPWVWVIQFRRIETGNNT